MLFNPLVGWLAFPRATNPFNWFVACQMVGGEQLKGGKLDLAFFIELPIVCLRLSTSPILRSSLNSNPSIELAGLSYFIGREVDGDASPIHPFERRAKMDLLFARVWEGGPPPT